MADQVTAGELIGWLKLPTPQPAADQDVLETIASAVTAFVETTALDAPRTADGAWAASTKLGALLLGARLHRRRNSPNGVELFTDQGAAYVVRHDSDVSRMLRLNLPKVG